MTAPAAQTVRSALLRFLDDDVRGGDLVTLMAPGQDVWWTAREAWEYRQLRTVVAGLKGQYVRDPLQLGMSDWEAVCLDELPDNPACRLGGTGDAAAARVRANTFRPGAPTTGPRAIASWALYRGDDLVREAPPTPIQPTADGRLTRTLGLSLEGALPGSYSLVLTVEDEATSRSVTRTEEFTVTGT